MGIALAPIPETMTAALLLGHGGLDRIVIRNDVPVPVLAVGEVLIRVGACGLNNTDLHNYNHERTGKPAPETCQGRLYASDASGLGVEPDLQALGAPVAVYGAPS